MAILTLILDGALRRNTANNFSWSGEVVSIGETATKFSPFHPVSREEKNTFPFSPPPPIPPSPRSSIIVGTYYNKSDRVFRSPRRSRSRVSLYRVREAHTCACMRGDIEVRSALSPGRAYYTPFLRAAVAFAYSRFRALLICAPRPLFFERPRCSYKRDEPR